MPQDLTSDVKIDSAIFKYQNVLQDITRELIDDMNRKIMSLPTSNSNYLIPLKNKDTVSVTKKHIPIRPDMFRIESSPSCSVSELIYRTEIEVKPVKRKYSWIAYS